MPISQGMSRQSKLLLLGTVQACTCSQALSGILNIYSHPNLISSWAGWFPQTAEASPKTQSEC